MKFLQHCGQCPRWKINKGEDRSIERPIGKCAKYDQDRHAMRELCKPEWDKEIKRLGKIVKAKDSQIKIMLLEKAVLDPKRTWEACGKSWPETKKAETKDSDT